MGKRGGFPGGMGGFGGMNINSLMKEAKKMQADLTKTQEEIALKEFDASVGGGAVEVKVSGAKVIKEIKIRMCKYENRIHRLRQYGICNHQWNYRQQCSKFV